MDRQDSLHPRDDGVERQLVDGESPDSARCGFTAFRENGDREALAASLLACEPALLRELRRLRVRGTTMGRA